MREPIGTSYTRELRVKLTAKEHRAAGETLAQQTRQLEAMQDEHKGLKAAMRDKEKALQAIISAKAEDVETGAELRDVEVCWHANLDENTKELVRADTDEVIHSQALSPQERDAAMQGDMPFEPPADDDGSADTDDENPLPPEPTDGPAAQA